MITNINYKNITFHIYRFNIINNEKKSWKQKFIINVNEGMTVLDGLNKIKETLDPSLSFRYSCRMGICGSCAMVINGKPYLACNTQILDFGKTNIYISPLQNFNIIKDLVPDLTSMFKLHTQIMPYIKRKDQENNNCLSIEYYQSPDQLKKFIQFAYCIKCGSCMASCPITATDRKYFGPMPLTQAYRYLIDNRDDAEQERYNLMDKNHSLYNCHYAGECSRICPKGVDPAKAIQLMKRNFLLNKLKLKKRKKCTCLNKEKKINNESKILAPPFNVKKSD